MSLIYHNESLLFASTSSSQDYSCFLIQLFLLVLIHLFHLPVEFVLIYFNLFCSLLFELLGFDFHLPDLHLLCSKFLLFLKISVLIFSIHFSLSLDVPLKLCHLIQEILLLIRIHCSFNLFPNLILLT